MKNFNLNSVALLCEFTASTWTARMLDRKKSAEVVENAGAKAKGAARVNKNLLSGRPELEEITLLVSEARRYVAENTTPWSDTGTRLLITSRLPKFDERIEGFKVQFNDKVATFVDMYPTLITAQAMALGDMFNRAEFPMSSEIAHKFAMACDYTPVPQSGDIRVDISNQAQNELRERLEFSSSKRLDKAMGDVTKRFTDHLQRMADRLMSDTQANGELVTRKFHDTLVTSAFDLCDLVSDYNITGDPVLAAARVKLETALTGVTAGTLRDNPKKREEVRSTVAGLLGKFNFAIA